MSRYVDNCCLWIKNYTAPGLAGSNLLLVPDPDTARSMPPGYFWPYDGTEGLAMPSLGQAGGSSRATSQAVTAGIVVGVVLGCALIAALLAVLVLRRRRWQQQQEYISAAGGGFKAAAGDSRDTACSACCRGLGPHSCSPPDWHASPQLPCNSKSMSRTSYTAAGYVGAGAAGYGDSGVTVVRHGVAASGKGSSDGMTARTAHEMLAQPAACKTDSVTGNSGELQRASGGAGTSSGGAGCAVVAGEPSSGAAGVLSDKRWLKLTRAISGKVQDIHQNRLKSALLQLQPLAVVAGSTAGGSAAGSAATHEAGSSSSSSSHGSAGEPAAGTLRDADGSPTSASAAAGRSSTLKQPVASNVLQLKEVIGQGSFGIVYR